MKEKNKTNAKVVVLIACSKKKGSKKDIAEDLYQGDLFKKSLEYARTVLGVSDSNIHILSDLHRLVDLNQKVEPYEVNLKKMDPCYKEFWTYSVLKALCKRYAPLAKCHFVVLAGDSHYNDLLRLLPNYCLPLQGIGKRGQQEHARNPAIATTTKLTSWH